MFLSKEEFVVQNKLIINKITLKGKILSAALRSKKITFLDKDLKEKTVTLKHTKGELYSLRDYYKKYKRLGVLIKGDFLELDSGELEPDFLVIGTPRVFEERKF